MKENFTEIMDSLDPRELDTLLAETRPTPVDGAASGRIRSAVFAKCSIKEKHTVLWHRIAAAAACLVLLISAGFGTYAYAAEVKEYNAAVQFFDEYGLSTEGLTRTEIKAVYRDITTESFTYGKTAEVILSATRVDGYEIKQDTLTSEELESLWNDREERRGIHYQVLTVDPDKYYLQKYDGETLLWSVDCSDYSYPYYTLVSDGILVHHRHHQTRQALLRKYDYEGNLLWNHQENNGFAREYIAAVLENSDGSYAVISNARTSSNAAYVCLSLYTADGERTLYTSSEVVGNAMDAVRLWDGYLVRMGTGEILKMDHEGNLTKSFSYSSEECNYHIQDMIEYDGNIYLSAYATPKLSDGEPTYGSRTEIARILDYAFSQENLDIPSEELTPVVQANYTAILLVCDPDSGTPQEFYSVKGSLGGDLSISDNGDLLWDVESITTTFFSPATSSFTIGGTCYIYRYTFGARGKLLSQQKTGEVTEYRR